MKLRTSYFNSTVLKKDITRFAPVWVLYALFQLMTVLLMSRGHDSAARFAADADDIMRSMGTINFCYAGLCAILLFGDLFSGRNCNALHAMPMRREGWFLTHLCAGFLFFLIPCALGAGLAALLLEEYFFLALLWLAVMALQFLFFFGAGAFSALCAGNRIGMLAVYGIFNFLSVLVTGLVSSFYLPLLYGLQTDMERYLHFSPVVGFMDFAYVKLTYDKIRGTIFSGIIASDWLYTAIAAGVGVLLLVASVALYRKRKLENAGNFISVAAVSPVFLILYTLGVGMLFYLFSELFDSGIRYLFLAFGLIIGFFTGKMLLDRKVNVFRGKTFLGLACLVVIFAATLVAARLDPLGITRYVPQPQQVASVELSTDQQWLSLSEEQDIQAITRLHRSLIGNPGKDDYFRRLELRYKMKDGTTVSRQYYMDDALKTDADLKRYLNNFASIFGREKDVLLDTVLRIEIQSNYTNTPPIILCNEMMYSGEMDMEKYEGESFVFTIDAKFSDSPVACGLMDALLADSEAGNLTQSYFFHDNETQYGWITFEMLPANKQTGKVNTYGTEFASIQIYESAANTIAYIQSLLNQSNG